MTTRKIMLCIILLGAFFGTLIAIGTRPIVEDIKTLNQRTNAFCENLYFQPNAQERMEAVGCNIEETEQRILKVKQGDY